MAGRFKGKFVKKSTINKLKHLKSTPKCVKSLYNEDTVGFPLTGKQQEGALADLSPEPVDYETPNIPKSSSIEGRRIVDIEYMAAQMICEKCSGRLHLMDIVQEQRYGLASLFTVVCPHPCSHPNKVATSRRKEEEGDRSRPFVVNCKSVIGEQIYI